MLLSRGLVIYSLVPVVGKMPGSDPIDRSYQTVMYWGGLRGGIALAIALSLPDTLAVKGDFITIATGAVLFTLLVQGLTIERLVKHFGLHVPTWAGGSGSDSPNADAGGPCSGVRVKIRWHREVPDHETEPL